jgi:hypothetical protein
MTLRRINITIGIIQIILCGLTIAPLTIKTIVSKGGGFGFGLIFLPILIPLSCSILFGLIGLLNYLENYRGVKLLLAGTHFLTAVAGIGSFLLIPLFPFVVITIPLAIWLGIAMTRENIGKQLLLTNGLLTTCMIAFLSFCIYGTDKNLIEYVIGIWK